MGYIKDTYQTISQFFKDVKNGMNNIGLRLDDLESRREDILGGGLTQEEENGKEYKAGEGILITDDDSIVLNYNGPFAYHLDHIDTTTTTTLWVTRSVGYVVRNGVRKIIYANTTPASMASGESAWMLYNTNADSYSISIQTNAPTATSDKICVKLAENVNGVLRQIQFGEVVVATGGTASIGFPDYLSSGSQQIFTRINYQITSPSWLVGSYGYASTAHQEKDLTMELTDLSDSSIYTSIGLFSFDTRNLGSNISAFVPICIPIPSGVNLWLYDNSTTSSSYTGCKLYPCVTT